MLLKRLSFDDVLFALQHRRYAAAGSISLNLVRNKLKAANAYRRSKWYLR